MIYYSIIPSPIDPLLLTSDGTALTGLYMTPHQYGPSVGGDWVQDERVGPLPETARQLQAYFAGQLTQFDLPLQPQGTPFQQRVWAELERIPFGVTISYGELARRLGDVNASRAVGLANGRNPISIIVPCHRVIGANGKLTGYGGGLPRKQALLAFEANVLANGAVNLAEMRGEGQIGLL
ncbi:MAG: methylated-DNA--[protein]-cysteine S-methyltransferase [Anaerolineae bacterium]|nr:methylated-DNA--[protein]-cysteine S-methyltransferase [Anaerolineae bacterium]